MQAVLAAVIDVARFEDLDPTFRTYGRLGWSSGEIPPGEYPFSDDDFPPMFIIR